MALHVKMPNLSDIVEYHAFDNGAWMAQTMGNPAVVTGIIVRVRRSVGGTTDTPIIPEGPWAIKPGIEKQTKTMPHAHSFSISQMASSLVAESWNWKEVHHLVAYMMAHAQAMHMAVED